MKRSKILVVGGLFIISMFMLSCQENEVLPGTIDPVGSVAGTYKGTITDNSTGQVYEAAADVKKSGDSIVEIHCYSDALDSTFVMEVFENGDNMMLCNVGDDFENQYGHPGMKEHHNMMGGDSEGRNWMHHMEEEHDQDDEHFGEFDMGDHTFSYDFVMEDNHANATLQFKGIK